MLKDAVMNPVVQRTAAIIFSLVIISINNEKGQSRVRVVGIIGHSSVFVSFLL
jgi:hypothetical protein